MDYARLSFWSFGNWNSLFFSNEQRFGIDDLVILFFFFLFEFFFSCVWSELFDLLPFLNSDFISILHYFEIWISNFFLSLFHYDFVVDVPLLFLVHFLWVCIIFKLKLHILLWLILNSFWFLFLSSKFGVTE